MEWVGNYSSASTIMLPPDLLPTNYIITLDIFLDERTFTIED